MRFPQNETLKNKAAKIEKMLQIQTSPEKKECIPTVVTVIIRGNQLPSPFAGITAITVKSKQPTLLQQSMETKFHWSTFLQAVLLAANARWTKVIRISHLASTGASTNRNHPGI